MPSPTPPAPPTDTAEPDPAGQTGLPATAHTGAPVDTGIPVTADTAAPPLTGSTGLVPTADTGGLPTADTGPDDDWSFTPPIVAAAPNLVPTVALLHVPSLQPVRAVVVFEEHVGGAVEYASADWRDFAATEGLALLQVELEPDNGRETAFDFPDQAALQLVSTLDVAALESGHPELASVPIVVFGHSAGSQLMVVLAAELPDRILGWIGYKGGVRAFNQTQIDNLGLLDPAFLALPGLLVVAEHEPEGLQDAAFALETAARAHDGLVAVAIEIGGLHIATGTSREITIPFVRELLEVRLSPTGALVPLAQADGWTGHLVHHREPGPPGQWPYERVDSAEIAPFGAGTWSDDEATWLMSEDFANTWLAFETP
ncbi:MAG: hypothetical protein R3F61_32470 [Myxococcota bacterium]